LDFGPKMPIVMATIAGNVFGKDVQAYPKYGSEKKGLPTTYYLTCPHLVAAVSRVEAAGGVERWSGRVEHDSELALSLRQATDRQRELRRRLARKEQGTDRGKSLAFGIGGSRNPAQLQCLHAHAAFALANPGYELGERILEEVEPLWPAGCCTHP